MELFFYSSELLEELPPSSRSQFKALAERLHIPEGRPFFFDEESLPDSFLDGFCKYLIEPSRPSSRTWRTYTYQISILLRFCDAQGIDWRKITRDELNTYYRVRTTKKFHNSDPITNRSWNLAVAAIVHLYEYALEVGEVDTLPFKYLKDVRYGGKAVKASDLSAKSSNEPINFISITDYKAAWRPALAATRNAQRDLALVDLLVTSGLRISEALSLQVHQIPDPDTAKYRGRKSIKLRVIGKGNRIREVRLPKKIARAIRFYIDDDRGEFARGKGDASDDPIFLTRHGSALAARSVQGLFERISEATGIKVAPHGCRHTFAVYQLDAMIKRLAQNLKQVRKEGADAYRQLTGDPLRDLQRLLGHSSISSTYIYLDFLEDSEELVDASLGDWTDWLDGNDKN